MDNFLYYILKSTVCICCLFLVFRILMSKEACFSVNRVVLLAVIAGSILIPIIYPPQLHTPVRVELIPEFSSNHIQIENLTVANYGNSTQGSKVIEQTGNILNVSLIIVLKYIYLSGLLIAFVFLMWDIIKVILLLRKSTVLKIDGYRVMLSERNVPSFAFAHSILISRNDYETYGSSILPHEKAHIRLNHFYDLMFLELVKVFHWFNPAIYGIIRNLKEIHEFQADDFTLHSGVEASQYKLLLIEKCVGPKRFALANSFNHCQIKKRIIMMNKKKNSKAWRWKVATFLPILAFLLMAFGNSNAELSKNPVLNGKKNEQVNAASVLSQSQQQSTDRVIQIKSGGNYIGNNLCTLEEIIKNGKEWQSASNDWILLQLDESIPYGRVDEVMVALDNAEVYHITQSFSGSDEIIYFAGDVSSMAKFKEGKWNDWFNDEIDKLLDDKSKSLEYKIRYTFIIDKNGKVRDGHITKPCEYTEINAVYEKVLAQIPDWHPAQRSGKPVSVYYKEIRSQRINKK